METNVTDRYTEIYANGGGNWLTESYATNFHHFYKQKQLVGDEKPEDFKEITAAQKTALEASDAAWVRPPQSFIDEWLAAGYTYKLQTPERQYTAWDEKTGNLYIYDELVTYEKAKEIMSYKPITDSENLWNRLYNNERVIPFLPLRVRNHGGTLSFSFSFCKFTALSFEIANYSSLKCDTAVFNSCGNLEKIYGYINDSSALHANLFNGCSKLKYLEFYRLKSNLNLQWSPLITAESLAFIIENAANTAAITITVHADVYAKLTGDETKAAYNNLSDEEKAQWTALIALAAEKNIQFASA